MQNNKWLLAFFLALVCGLGSGAGFLFAQHRIDARAAQAANARLEMDIPFLQHMSVHHDQALTMAQIIQGKLQNAAQIDSNAVDHALMHRAAVLGLAKSIEVSQRTEMGIFRGWLMLWEAEFVPRKVTMDWMVPNANEDELAFISRCRAVSGGMEGMATMDELNRLNEATPTEAVDLFLELMRKHHEAALPMLGYAARNAHTPQVKQLALAMWSEQRKELLQIQKLTKPIQAGR
ncbi:MAG: DUF305 domain-containing protein [Limnobacter sp.]|nr:DUF305 domain-containing protein [Limnobacter sp.]